MLILVVVLILLTIVGAYGFFRNLGNDVPEILDSDSGLIGCSFYDNSNEVLRKIQSYCNSALSKVAKGSLSDEGFKLKDLYLSQFLEKNIDDGISVRGTFLGSSEQDNDNEFTGIALALTCPMEHKEIHRYLCVLMIDGTTYEALSAEDESETVFFENGQQIAKLIVSKYGASWFGSRKQLGWDVFLNGKSWGSICNDGNSIGACSYRLYGGEYEKIKNIPIRICQDVSTANFFKGFIIASFATICFFTLWPYWYKKWQKIEDCSDLRVMPSCPTEADSKELKLCFMTNLFMRFVIFDLDFAGIGD